MNDHTHKIILFTNIDTTGDALVLMYNIESDKIYVTYDFYTKERKIETFISGGDNPWITNEISKSEAYSKQYLSAIVDKGYWSVYTYAADGFVVSEPGKKLQFEKGLFRLLAGLKYPS